MPQINIESAPMYDLDGNVICVGGAGQYNTIHSEATLGALGIITY